MGETEPAPDIMVRVLEAGGAKVISTRSLVKLKRQREDRYGLVGLHADERALHRLTEVGLPTVNSLFIAACLCSPERPPSVRRTFSFVYLSLFNCSFGTYDSVLNCSWYWHINVTGGLCGMTANKVFSRRGRAHRRGAVANCRATRCRR